MGTNANRGANDHASDGVDHTLDGRVQPADEPSTERITHVGTLGESDADGRGREEE